jgi:uncharacterized cupin superfamily protein
MDVLIDWANVPWDEPEDEPQPGMRSKTHVRDGQEVWLAEFSEAFVRDDWCTEAHLFHVVEGESSLRFKDGRVIRLRPGDTGIILAGEADAHSLEVAAGERLVLLGFEQP